MKKLLIVVVSVCLCACTTFRSAQLPSDNTEEESRSNVYVRQGDHVRIQTRNGQVRDLKVVSITAESVVGENVTIPVADIVTIESRQFSGSKTTGLVLGVLGVAIVGAIVNVNEHY